MRTIILIIIATLCANLIAQVTPEVEVKSKISDVTVYITGAQIKRTADIDINAGKTILKFVDLSPYIEAKSINVKSTGEFTILSVNHYQNFLKQRLNEES